MNSWIADISLWRFPASAILAAAFLLAVWALHRYGRHMHLHRILSGSGTAVGCIVLLALAVAAEGTWGWPLHRSYPFVALLLLTAMNLGLVTLRRLPQRNAGFLLNHAGLFVILWAAAFGAPDVAEARMIVRTGETSHTAFTPEGEAVPLPFEVRLDRFETDFYDDDRTPRQFRSRLRIDGVPRIVEVNAPVRYGGYTLYQDGYDTRRGTYTVLLLVRDPWLWIVWPGVAMLAAGSLILLFRRQ